MSERPLAVITGASSGIGRATALVLARSGWRLVLVARGRDALEETARAVGEAGGVGVVEVADATDPAAVEALAARVLARDGVPDAVVNSAGSGEWRFIEELPAAAGGRMLGAPFLAAYHFCAVFTGPMLARGKGCFVHVGSPASILPWSGATAYAASRWALRGLHEALCADFHATPLRSCHVVLGEVRTAYFERAAGSHERIPLVARIIPVLDADAAGRIVAAAVTRPRRQIVAPFVLRVFAWAGALAPALVRWIVHASGARRAR